MSSYKDDDRADDRELSAIRLAQAVLGAEGVVDPHRKEMLGIAVWKYTEAKSSKYGLRYRTPAAISAGPTVKLQHEHVRTKAAIVQELLAAGPSLAPVVLSSAVGCVVTKDEHAMLTALPKSYQGWARYSAAGLSVIDGVTGRSVEPGSLESDYGQIDLDAVRRLSPGGGARVCLLAACRLLDAGADAEWLHLAVRDTDSVETWWIRRRFAQRGDGRVSADWADLLGDVREAGRRFDARPLLGAAAALEELRAPWPLGLQARAHMAERLIVAAALDEAGRADPAAAPLAKAAILAADRDDVPGWPQLAPRAGSGRYLPLLSEDDGGALESMRRIAHLYGDPVLDLALTVFEKRSRAALRQRPPAAVVEWVLSRC
jgi:hypothetical protein